MKKLKLFFVFFLFTNTIFSQKITSGYIEYKTEFIGELSPEKVPYDKYLQTLVPTINRLKYTLKFDKTKSVFFPKKQLDNDFSRSLKSATSFVGRNSYFNEFNGEFIKEMDIAGDIFLVELEKKLNWKITNETKDIGDFNCYKATTEIQINNGKVELTKKISAWFTNEIPISTGPKEYVGLPGLILELIDGDIKFSAVSIEFTEQILNNPKKGIRIKENKLEQYIKNLAREKWGVKD